MQVSKALGARVPAGQVGPGVSGPAGVVCVPVTATLVSVTLPVLVTSKE